MVVDDWGREDSPGGGNPIRVPMLGDQVTELGISNGNR